MLDQTPAKIAEWEGRIDKLQAAADGAAGEVRNLYIAFLSFGLYLAITVGATTDEQLLRESPVSLPIVGVDLPLFAFYWIAPLLFVLFHFNLLLQLCLLSEKLHRLDTEIRRLPDDAQGERRAAVSQFVFSQMLIGDHCRPLIRVLLQLIAWTTFVVLPIAVLLLTQIQFLPYHDAFTTWWQRFLIVLDLLALWLLWLLAIDPTGRLGRQLRPAWPVFGLASLSAVSLLMAFPIAAIPGEFLASPIDSLTGHGNIGVLNRNLTLREAQLVLDRPPPGLAEDIGEEAAFENYTRGLDLRGRDLRYADFYDADLRKADLRGSARLEGANLGQANLEGANLSGADLQGANLSEANVQGADLSEANLRGADLESADLQGASLRRADLQSAALKGADLRGADLGEADLQGAALEGADLEGAELWGANLQGADFKAADLQGANLGGADLRGVDLEWTDLRGADLGGADLQGAYLGGADLQGANLGWANLRGADLRNADLQGADLGKAALRVADLRNAGLWRATIGDEPDRDDLWGLANMRGADVEPADLSALIAAMQRQIAYEPTRTQVIERLQSALRDEDRPDVPSWHRQPNVVFELSDPIPRALGWSAPTVTDADYDEKLAVFLGNLACCYASPALAQGIAGRTVQGATPYSGEPERLLYHRLAQRLTPDDPEACPAAGALPEELRAQLEQLADRRERPPSDQAKPCPAPPDAPPQEPQPPGTPSSPVEPTE
jgi:uncharacterized protein YjbI with pentapeptide repeats